MCTRCGLNSLHCKVPPNTASTVASNCSLAYLNRFYSKRPLLNRTIYSNYGFQEQTMYTVSSVFAKYYWPSWTHFYSVKRPLLNRTIYTATLVSDNRRCIRFLRCLQNIIARHCRRTTYGHALSNDLFWWQHIPHSRRLSTDKILT